jgi:hypothetical protein
MVCKLDYEALDRAINTTSGAEERWAERKKTGLTDELLYSAIKYELGIEGGSTLPNGDTVHYIASGLRICRLEKGAEFVYPPTPVFSEQKTVNAVRELYKIKDPSSLQHSLFQS